MYEQLPRIDIAPLFAADADSETREHVDRQLLDSCHELGFLLVDGHGVPPACEQALRDAIAALFARPREQLARQCVQPDNYRGYVPAGFFTPNDGRSRPDNYEAWKLHHETAADDPICKACTLYGPNRWPDDADDLRQAVADWWAHMTRVSDALLAALGRALGLDTDYLQARMAQPLTNMTLLNYPPQAPSDDSWGIHPHKDFNLLTLLAHDPVGGLELRRRDGQWISADCPPGALVVNVGDMLELWSGGRLISTPHRVVNRSGRARQSFPYFAVPRFDTAIEPLLPPVEGFDRQALHCGRASADIWLSNWPERAAQEPGQELGEY